MLYLLSAYAQLVGFGGGAELVKNSASPMNTLADSAGVHPLGYLIDLGATASFFACITGSLNAAARLLLAMSRARLLPAAVGRVHATHRTPHRAIGVLCGIALITALALLAGGQDAVSVFAIAGTIGTYGYMLAYLLLCLGTPVYLRRTGAPAGWALVVGGLASLAMIYVAFRAVYPVQAYPYDILPLIFLAVMAVAMAWYAVARARNGGPVLIQDGPSDEVLDLRDAPSDAEVTAQEGASAVRS